MNLLNRDLRSIGVLIHRLFESGGETVVATMHGADLLLILLLTEWLRSIVGRCSENRKAVCLLIPANPRHLRVAS